MSTVIIPRQRVRVGDLELMAVGAAGWRVVESSGRVRGHIDQRDEPEGTRYRARRYRAATASFFVIGEFWSLDDALAALRG